MSMILSCILECMAIGLEFWSFTRCFHEKRLKFHMATILYLIIVSLRLFVQICGIRLEYLSYMRVVGDAVLDAMILTLFWQCMFKMALCWTLFYNVNWAMVKVFVIMLEGIVGGKDFIQANVWNRNYILESICGLLFCSVLVIFSLKKENQIHALIEELKNKSIWSFIFFEILEYCFVFILLEMGGPRYKPIHIMLEVFVLISFVFFFSLRAVYVLYQNAKEKEGELEKRQEILVRAQRNVKEYYEQIAKDTHDIKYILLYLKKCINTNEIKEAEECLERTLGEMGKMGRQAWTGVSAVDISMDYAFQKISDAKIQFTCNLDIYEIPIPDMEFMVILGNIMDNAIEAAGQCDCVNRKIELKIKNIGQMCILLAKNTYKGEVEDTNLSKRGITTKNNKIQHGWGIENVRHIVEKYDGNFSQSYNDGWFETRIMFYKKEIEK